MSSTRGSASSLLRLVTLLHIADGNEEAVNLKGGLDPITVYLRCAELCAISAAHHGLTLTVVTNKAELLHSYCEQLSLTHLAIDARTFVLDVPRGIPFHSAHFKIELINYIGEGSFGPYVGLIDSDIVLLRPPMPDWQPDDSLHVYDISDQVFPEYGFDRVKRDLELVAGVDISQPRWFGGEYLLGSANQFRILSDIADECWPRYLLNIERLHHNGDEMVVSAALNIGSNRGLKLSDAEASRSISRWWTARTGFEQKPFGEAALSALLHLPSDKDFLASRPSDTFDPTLFVDDYRKYAKGKLARRQVVNMLDRVRGRSSRYVARLK